ncbi:MAG: PD-(D/E)XK nuclease family protein [Ghiorsea sp.]|nr:PD-(D/E)XK nuclease family protein [Ghiorsea sp.]
MHVIDCVYDGLETPTLGLTAAEQGTLLHAALEYFWKQTKNSTVLLQYINDGSLDQHIQAAATHAWSDIRRLISQDIKSLETQRLQQLMQQWLHFESTREPFTVTGFEFWQTVTLGTSSALVLHTKIDRSDQTASGHRIIIDYKTGLVSANKALGDRPDEPQLPIYYMAAQSANMQVDALAFAQVRNGELKFDGFSQESDILPKLKAYKPRNDQPEDWQALTEHWQDTLNNLADEFMAGERRCYSKDQPKLAPIANLQGYVG